jgi:hypothetical protein
MSERLVFIGIQPEAIVIASGEQVAWLSNAGVLRIEFDPKRCPFATNIFQAPSGVRLLSGPPRPGSKPGSYRYTIRLNDLTIGEGEVILREAQL